jgi:hypothetical protein
MDGMDDFGPTRLIDDKSLGVLRAKSRTIDGMLPVVAVVAAAPQPAARRRWWTLGAAVICIALGFTAVALLRPDATADVAAETRIVMDDPAPLAVPPWALLQAAASREVAATALTAAAKQAISSPRPRALRRPSPSRRLSSR